MSNFTYSLRYTLDPRTNTEKKNKEFLEFVQKAKIDNVAFFINPEELNASHLTAEETQLWLDKIAPLQEKLKALKISTSLNPWTTIMHSDRGETVNPEIGFETLVDINGKKATSLGCPADPKWQDYLAKRYAQYATLKPQELWLEDDFRHYNHTPLKLACFCPRHMAIYSDLLGKNISRTDFVKAVLQTGTPSAERKIYLTTARNEMIATVKQIEHAVHNVSRETNLALMTSFPDWHAVEGRDWATLFDSLAGTAHPRVARPHLPAYNEIAPLKYSRLFEQYTRTTAAYLGDDAILLPELENYMYSGFVKSVNFTKFQIETSILIGASGILLNLFDMIGNGINNSYEYAEMLSEIKPFLNKVSERPLKLTQTRGIKILIDQDSSFTIHTSVGADPTELLPHETNWAALLSTFGFSTTITPLNKTNNFSDETIAISGQLLRNMSNNEIIELVNKNTILLDGESIQVIIDRGLGGQLLHLRSSEWHQYRTGYQSYEQFDGLTIEGVDNPRVTMLQHTGNYLQLEYQKNHNVAIWSSAYNKFGQRLGNVMVVIDKHIILLPMDHDPKYGWESQYSSYKQVALQQILDSIIPTDYLVGMPNVKLNVARSGKTLWLSNFTLDSYSKIVWHPSTEILPKTAKLIRRNSGKYTINDIKLNRAGDNIEIEEQINSLETIQIIL